MVKLSYKQKVKPNCSRLSDNYEMFRNLINIFLHEVDLNKWIVNYTVNKIVLKKAKFQERV